MNNQSLRGLLLILLALVLLIWTTVPASRLPAESTEGSHRLSKYDRIELAIAQEVEMTQDPALGYVPRERLMAAYQYAQRKRQTQVSRGAVAPLIWEERGPNNVGGRTRTLLIDANDPTRRTVWAAGVAGGLWRSNDITAPDPAWQPIDDFFENLAISAIAQDPSNPDVMYFGTGEGWFNADAVRGLGLWKSSDGGINWQRLSSTTNDSFHYTQKIVVDPQGTLFVATRNGGLLRSSDGGDSWTRVLGSNLSGAISNRIADIERAANGDLWASVGIFQTGRLFRSSDGGDTWTRILQGSGFPQIQVERLEIACAPSDASRVYVLAQGTDNDCEGIYRTDDGGSSWVACENPPALGMDNFCRGQAWYDLIAAVDPNQPDRLFIGGIDLLVSDDAGQNFQQVSQWFGGGGFQYVHADQHAIIFEPGNSDVVYVGNDGGVYRSGNATASIPTFQDRNFGYNVTQYYACAVGPDPAFEDIIAGTQDNGTQRYRQLGINSTVEITGGDGAFCHIDQDNGNVQISSYVYNSYWVTNNGWLSNQRLNFEQSGRFINPTDYDSRSNILYACTNSGRYLRISRIGDVGIRDTTISIAGLGGTISAITVSPHTENRVFMAASGRVVQVDEAHSANPEATLLNGNAAMPTGYISCIAVSPESDDHLLVTYSNYGLASVWETRNRGASWRLVEGDLPDMPVRWALFHPRLPDQAMLATELGVWSTDSLQAESVDWEPSNQGLANVRTDMLELRQADHLVVAATHGRGLYTSTSLDRVTPTFAYEQMPVVEANITDECPGYTELLIPVMIDRAPREAITLEVAWVMDSSTVDSADVTWVGDPTVVFPAGQTTSQFLRLRVWEDGVAEGTERLRLRLLPTDMSRVYPSQLEEMTVYVRDSHPDPQLIGQSQSRRLLDESFNGPIAPAGWTMTRADASSDQFRFGLPEDLTEKPLEIPTDRGGAAINNDQLCDCDKREDWLISPPMDLSRASTALLSFQAYFAGNGSDQAILQLSVDGGTSWESIPLATLRSWLDYTLDLAPYGATGQDEVYVAFTYRDGGGQGGVFAIDEVRVDITEEPTASVASELTAVSFPVGPRERVDFYSPTGKLMATLDNASDHDFGCVSLSIDRSGTGTSDFWSSRSDRWDLADKTYFLTAERPSETAAYRITLYLTPDEVAGFEAATGYRWEEDLRVLRLSGSLTEVSPTNPYPNGERPVQVAADHSELAEGEIRLVTASFTGEMGGFGLGNPGEDAIEPANLLDFSAVKTLEAVDLSWTIAQEQSVAQYVVQRITEADGDTWREKGSLAADGNASYALRDDAPQWGLNRYRLQVTYLDGGIEFSEEKALYFYGDLADWRVFPTPFSDAFSVAFPEGFEEALDLRLTDGNGREVWQGSLRAQAGRLGVVNPGALVPGVYLLRMSVGATEIGVQKLRKVD